MERAMQSRNHEYVPPPSIPSQGAHERVRQALPAWASLNDEYVFKVLQNGLKLNWVQGFNPTNPNSSFRPKRTFNKPDLPPEVASLVREMLLDGSISEVEQS